MNKKWNWKCQVSEYIKAAKDLGYYIDEVGNVYSPRGNKLKPIMMGDSRPSFSVRYNSKNRNIMIHRYIMYLIYGDILFDFECVRHLDGNPLNNHPLNLALGSQKDNMFDIPKVIRSRRIKTRNTKCILSGTGNYIAWDIRIRIYKLSRRLYKVRGAINAIARKFGVTRQTVRNIREVQKTIKEYYHEK